MQDGTGAQFEASTAAGPSRVEALGAEVMDAEALDARAVVKARRAIMALCAVATKAELDQVLGRIGPVPAAEDLRRTEAGLVMLRGRMGGDGRPFNLGEATVTRAAVRLADGRTGFAYQLGRDSQKARVSAILDALCQGGERGAVERALLSVQERIETETARKARRVAATRVDFFTMVRGED